MVSDFLIGRFQNAIPGLPQGTERDARTGPGTEKRRTIFCGGKRKHRENPDPINEHRRGIFPFGRLPRRCFLVYIAAVLFYEPIFTQPLGFVPCTAGAVEKFATDGAVSVRSTGSEVVLPQKRRSIFCPIASRCGCIRPAFSAGWGRPVRGNAVSFRLRPDQGKGWRGIQPVCAAAWRGTGR